MKIQPRCTCGKVLHGKHKCVEIMMALRWLEHNNNPFQINIKKSHAEQAVKIFEGGKVGGRDRQWVT